MRIRHMVRIDGTAAVGSVEGRTDNAAAIGATDLIDYSEFEFTRHWAAQYAFALLY